MDIDAKLRPIYLIKILRERTDEDHYLSTAELCKILKDEYGMDTHRTTIKTDDPTDADHWKGQAVHQSEPANRRYPIEHRR